MKELRPLGALGRSSTARSPADPRPVLLRAAKPCTRRAATILLPITIPAADRITLATAGSTWRPGRGRLLGFSRPLFVFTPTLKPGLGAQRAYSPPQTQTWCITLNFFSKLARTTTHVRTLPRLPTWHMCQVGSAGTG
jgi:hypothetical protein